MAIATVEFHMPQVKVEFCILGNNFNPKDITNILKITPNKECVIDHQTKKTQFSEVSEELNDKETSWSISTDLEDSRDIDEQIYKIYNKLKHKQEKLQHIKKLYSLIYKFNIIICFADNGQTPGIGLDKDIIQFASQIGASINFHTYRDQNKSKVIMEKCKILDYDWKDKPETKIDKKASEDVVLELVNKKSEIIKYDCEDKSEIIKDEKVPEDVDLEFVPKVMVEFCILEDNFSPEDITNILGITPDEQYVNREFLEIEDEVRKCKVTCWSISTELVESNHVNEQVYEILGRIKNKYKELLYIKGIYPVYYKFIIVIYFDDDGKRPSLILNEDIVQFAAQIGAFFDLDTYV